MIKSTCGVIKIKITYTGNAYSSIAFFTVAIVAPTGNAPIYGRFDVVTYAGGAYLCTMTMIQRLASSRC